MAISPTNLSIRNHPHRYHKTPEQTELAEDSTFYENGQSVIDNTSEYASMGMLASQFSSKKDILKKRYTSSEYAESILDNKAEEKIEHIEKKIELLNSNKESLQNYITSFFPDPSDLALALAELLRRKTISKESQEILEEILESLLKEEKGRFVKSGINVGRVAREFASKHDKSANKLRDIYRDFICYEGPIVYLYEVWMNELEENKRESLYNFLAKALSCDLQAGPLCSINISEFGNLFGRIGDLRKIYSAELILAVKIRFLIVECDINIVKTNISSLILYVLKDSIEYRDKIESILNSFIDKLSFHDTSIFLQTIIIALSNIAISLYTYIESRDEALHLLKEKLEYYRLKETQEI